MNHDFAGLSHSDFEDLARDLMGRELAVRFEAFPEGPDDGMPVAVRFAQMVGDVLTMGSARGQEKQPFKFYV